MLGEHFPAASWDKAHRIGRRAGRFKMASNPICDPQPGACGSSAYFFADSAITGCTSTNASRFYCPASPLAISAGLAGSNAASADASFTLYNAAVPGIGANSASSSDFSPLPASFDFGAPFFFGMTIFTAIEGSSAGGTAGPFVAF